MRESDIERYLVRMAKAVGGEVRKVQWIGRRGAPDRLVMLPRGLHAILNGGATSVWVELKAPGRKPTAQQRREHERMRRMGQTVVVIDSMAGVDALFSIA